MAPATRSAKQKALAERNMQEKCDQMGDFIKRPKECVKCNEIGNMDFISLSGERLQASLSEHLNRAGREIADFNQKIQALKDLYKPPQEHNTSLQRSNIQLQEELGTANDALKRVEKEKAAIMDNLSTLRGHYTSLQEQLTSSRNSQEEAVRQKEVLANEVQQLRDDRDRQLLQVQILTEELTKCHKFVGRSSADLDSLTVKLGSHGVKPACEV